MHKPQFYYATGGISLVITTSLSPTAPWVGHYWDGILEVAIITSTNTSPLTLVHLVWSGFEEYNQM